MHTVLGRRLPFSAKSCALTTRAAGRLAGHRPGLISQGKNFSKSVWNPCLPGLRPPRAHDVKVCRPGGGVEITPERRVKGRSQLHLLWMRIVIACVPRLYPARTYTILQSMSGWKGPRAKPSNYYDYASLLLKGGSAGLLFVQVWPWARPSGPNRSLWCETLGSELSQRYHDRERF